MSSETNAELVGANAAPLALEGAEVQTSVRLDPAPRERMRASLTPAAHVLAATEPPLPDRVFLKLENVTGNSNATTFDVYVRSPQGDQPEALAGSVGLFGLRNASKPDGKHGGQGLTYSIEITDIVDALHLNDALNVENLNVRIVPANPLSADKNIQIGRVSIYRQGK